MRDERFFGVLPVLAFVLAVWPAVTTGAENAPGAPAPRTDAPGWTARHESLNTRVKQGHADLILIGDALAQDWEEAGKEPWHKYYGTVNAVNLGISGDQPANILWRLDHGNLEGISPKLAMLMAGADTPTGLTPEAISEGVKAVVERLRAKLPKTKILMMGLLPGGLKPDDPGRQINAKANELISKLADNKLVFYMDLGPRFLAADGTLRKDLMPDLRHLSPEGYQLYAEWTKMNVTYWMWGMEDPRLPVPQDRPTWNGGWLKRHEEINARVRQGHVDLIFIGDSLVQGWDHEGKAVWDKYYGKRNAVNLGISADGIQNILWRLEHGNLDGITPKVAVVLAGASNAERSVPEQSAEGIKMILDLLRAKSPRIKIVLMAVFPRGDNNEYFLRKPNARVNELIAKFADDQNVFFLDLTPKFLNPDGTFRPDIMRDKPPTHPTANGFAIWAETMEPLVAKLMGEK